MQKRSEMPKSFTRVTLGTMATSVQVLFLSDSKRLWDEKQLSDNTISFPTSDSLQFWVYLVISDETCHISYAFNLSHCISFGVLWLWRRVTGWVGAGMAFWEGRKCDVAGNKNEFKQSRFLACFQGCLDLQKASYPGMSPANSCV